MDEDIGGGVGEKQSDGYVIVRIKDSGSGIDSEIFPRLFSKFTTKSEIGGTGLGLFVSKNIVEYGLRIILMVKVRPLHLVFQ